MPIPPPAAAPVGILLFNVGGPAIQSRTGPVKWIGPGTEEKLEELGREGVRDVLLGPLSFVSDHIETLYEADMLFADAAEAAGITDYRRPEALDTQPLFIEPPAQLVERHLATTADAPAAAAGTGASQSRSDRAR